MSASFKPSDDAVPGVPWNITFLSQRDVGLQIPINYVLTPSVSLRHACFAHNVYDVTAAETCISNLLSVGFRRLVVDLFWDPTIPQWSFCPVQLGSPGTNPTPTSTPIAQPTQSTNVNTGGPAASASNTLGSGEFDFAFALAASSTADSSNKTDAPTSSAEITPTPVFGTSNSFTIGPYTCDRSLNVDFLVSLFTSYIMQTDTTLAASIRNIIMNIHAAAPASDPTGPALAIPSSDTASGNAQLGTTFDSKLPTYLYTPGLLNSQREDLNSSWFFASNLTAPDPGYFHYTGGPGQVFTTPDGWPSESTLEFGNKRRLVLGFGSVDPQMSSYNTSADSDTIFPQHELDTDIAITYTPNGTVAAGCLFAPNDPTVEAANSSWAVATYAPTSMLFSNEVDPNLNRTIGAITNLTACGISPYLNTTLFNQTADANVTAYRAFGFASVWSWAPFEPADILNSKTFRCAVADPTSNGRWRVHDCEQPLHAACRADGLPYVWYITSSTSIYTSAQDLCPANSSFAVPRTSLENTYLLEAVQKAATDPHRVEGALNLGAPVWIDLNSLDVHSCWVVGANAQCPYQGSKNDEGKVIEIPTVAALVVLVITVLALLTKCGTNRQMSKRRRKVWGEWDYEGVPS